MKIKIEYKNDGELASSYWAYTYLPPNKVYESACGDSYEEAKAKLLNIIHRRIHAPSVPPPEEVEIEDGPNR